ncbi:unnamed protein product, partial [Oikopleura dioica]
ESTFHDYIIEVKASPNFAL